MTQKLKKILLLYLLTGTLFVSCTMEEEVIRNHNYSKEIKIYQKSFDELIKDSKFATSFNKLPKKKSALQTSTQARTVMEEQYGFTITNTPARVMQVGKITSYTFHIERENNNPSFFENLVIQNDSIGNTTAHIIKYTPFMPMTAFTEHNSYSFEGETEFTSIIYDDTQVNTTGKMVTTCTKIYSTRCNGRYSGACTGNTHIVGPDCKLYSPDCIFQQFLTETCATYDDGTDIIASSNGSSYGTGGNDSTDPIYSDPVCGSGCIEEEVNDPCTNASTAIANANALFNSPEVQQGMNDVLIQKINEEGRLPFIDQSEWGVAIGQSGTTLNVTAPRRGSATQGSIPSSQASGNYIADGHSHPTWGDACASGGDFYGMLNIIRNNSNYNTRFTYGIGYDSDENPVTDVYALVVTDRNAAINFLNQYPELQNINPLTHNFYESTEIGTEYYSILDEFTYGLNNINEGLYSSGAVALAYILNKYNTGISVAKVDANGNLQVINIIKEIIDTATNNFKLIAKKCQ